MYRLGPPLSIARSRIWLKSLHGQIYRTFLRTGTRARVHDDDHDADHDADHDGERTNSREAIVADTHDSPWRYGDGIIEIPREATQRNFLSNGNLRFKLPHFDARNNRVIPSLSFSYRQVYTRAWFAQVTASRGRAKGRGTSEFTRMTPRRR